MNPTIKALALLAAFGVPTLQAQVTREAPSTQQRMERAMSGLDFTAEQRARIDALSARYADSEPGASWQLAAEVESVLTDEQARLLTEKRSERRARRAQRHEGQGRAERGGRRMRSGAEGKRLQKAGRHLGLTDAQREQMKGHRDAARTEHEALREQLRSNAITAEQYAERAEALREQARAAAGSVLTAEQREKVEAAEARRQAERSAREAALQITPEQQAAFEAARADAARSGKRGAMRVLEAEILTDRQRQVVAVHRALSMRHGRRGVEKERGVRPEQPRSGRDAATE